MHRWMILGVALAAGVHAQTVSFSPQVSLGKSLTLWEADVSGVKEDVPAAQIWAVAAAHGLGHIENSTAAQLVPAAGGKTLASKILHGCTDAAAGAAIGAYIKGQANFATNQVATEIAVGATTVAGVCGLLLPTLQKDAAAAAPNPSLMGTAITVGSSGSGSGLFWARASGVAPFTDKLP
ncbi:MAG: hypothetical protein ACLQVN_17925 [Bryobacteraceae bacterium]